MPTFYNFTRNNITYSFDDVFVQADLFRQGNLWSWGLNNSGELGVNDTTQRNTPVTTFSGGANWKFISMGPDHSAGIKEDGTLWTWGLNGNGQLGNNSTTQSNTPVVISAGATNWKKVSCGYRHTAAVKLDGTLWVWGSNANGRLGTSDTTQRITPSLTFAGGNNWGTVDCGRAHTAALKTDGTLWTWGYAISGQLGTNDTTQRLTPVTTFAGGNNWAKISAGSSHMAAIKTDGTLWVWGSNANAQLGVNDTTNRLTPVTTFAGGNDWENIGSGNSHTTAIKTNKTLWVWGLGTNGRLGDSTLDTKSTPVTTFAGGNNWKSVSCGYRHTSAIKTDGTLWLWGDGASGQLGNNSTATPISTPVTTFYGGNKWKQISCFGYHNLAIEYEDSVLY